MTRLRNLAHDLVAIVGILAFLQVPVTAYLVSLSLPARAIGLGFGGVGLLGTVLSKLIDSRSYTQIAVADTGSPATPPVVVNTAPAPTAAPSA
jgi:hypothetical protein